MSSGVFSVCFLSALLLFIAVLMPGSNQVNAYVNNIIKDAM